MQRSEKNLFIVAAILVLFVGISANTIALDYVNAVTNGDFENGQTGWSGTVKSVTVDSQTVYVGENNVTQTARIQLRPNTTYNVRCLFMEKNKIEGKEDALFGIVLYDSQGNEITSSSQTVEQPQDIYYSTWKSVWYKYLSYFDAASSWDYCNFTFKTGDNTAEGLIKLILLNSSRTYYYDRIEIYEMPFSEYLHNGGFENSYAWNDREFGWTKSLGNSEIVSSSDSGFGNKHLKITGGAFYDRGAVRTFDKVLIKPNKEYTFSILLRADTSPVTTPALVGVKFYDKSGTQLTTGSDLAYSSFLTMHFRYIYKECIGTDWMPWKTRFITPDGAYSAEVFLYKWCSDQNGDPTYIEADQLSLTPTSDINSYANYGFEAVTGSTINQWNGGYTISTSAYDGRYALQVNNYDWAESNYIPVNGDGYYMFRAMVMEPQDVTAYNSVYFTVQMFDSNKTSLGQSVSVNNLGTHYDGVHWFAYLYGTPMDSTFEPINEWLRYERWFQLPSSVKYIKLRLWNNRSGYSTKFDNVELRELKYRTATQAGTKSMVLWYGNTSWPSPYISTSDKAQAFYPYIAHATSTQLNQFDEWMLESVLFMSSLPSQTPTAWNAYLDRLFATAGDWKWLLNLNEAVSDVGTILSDSTHKVNVVISIPLNSTYYSADNFSSVVSSPATDEKVADWYYSNVIQRWNTIQNSVTRLNLIGFYLEDEYPLGSATGFIKAMSENIKADGYKLYASPYIIKKEVTIDGDTKYRDLSRVSIYLPEFYDVHYIQPNYFYNEADRTSSLVDYTILWSGINNCGLNLEWTGNDDRFQHYLNCAKTYGMLNQDTSYMLFEVGGWLYNCATGTNQDRINLYDNLNNLLHNR